MAYPNCHLTATLGVFGSDPDAFNSAAEISDPTRREESEQDQGEEEEESASGSLAESAYTEIRGPTRSAPFCLGSKTTNT